jgi:hypothetical protein
MKGAFEMPSTGCGGSQVADQPQNGDLEIAALFLCIEGARFISRLRRWPKIHF